MALDVAIITGASGGMGEAIARRWARDRRLLLCGTSAAKLEELRRGLPGTGHEILPMDLADPDCGRAAARASEGMGQLKSFIHTAGISPTMGDPRRIVEVNLCGTARLIEALLPQAGSGTVGVLFSSIAGHLCEPSDRDEFLDDPLRSGSLERILEGADTQQAYGLSKRGVIRLAEGHAFAWGARQARLVSLSPGMIETKMWAQEMDDKREHMTGLLDMTPLQRIGGVEEIADAVDYLCSSRASFITGTDLLVDGGVTAVVRRTRNPFEG